MSSGPVRLVVATIVAVLLSRAAMGAWRHRELTLAVWRSITPRHLLGTFALLVAVVTVGSLLLQVTPLRVGLGELVGFSGNAVFTPLEEAASRAGPPPATGPDWYVVLLATAFLAFLALLLPWLAFVEEEIFRAGLEIADLRSEIAAALKFGLIHLLMLVPLAAALAIALAGLLYGRVYRYGYRTAEARRLPGMVPYVYRSTRRARRAAALSRLRQLEAVVANGPPLGPAAPIGVDPPSPELRQAAGVFGSTVWHATFNSIVVALLWAVIVVEALR